MSIFIGIGILLRTVWVMGIVTHRAIGAGAITSPHDATLQLRTPPPRLLPRIRINSGLSSKHARDCSRTPTSGDRHARVSSTCNFAGFNSFAEVRRGFEFNQERPVLIDVGDGKVATLKLEVEEQGKELRALNQKVDALATKVDNVNGKLTRILAALSSIQGMHLLFWAFVIAC